MKKYILIGCLFLFGCMNTDSFCDSRCRGAGFDCGTYVGSGMHGYPICRCLKGSKAFIMSSDGDLTEVPE